MICGVLPQKIVDFWNFGGFKLIQAAYSIADILRIIIFARMLLKNFPQLLS